MKYLIILKKEMKMNKLILKLFFFVLYIIIMDYTILKKCLNNKNIYKNDSEYRIILYRLNNLIKNNIIYLDKFKEIYNIDNRIESLCDSLLNNNKYMTKYILGII